MLWFPGSRKKGRRSLLSRLVVFAFLATALWGCSSGDVTVATDGNDYPVVLLHGFAGWGPDELDVGDIHLLYWGGFKHNIEASLNEIGIEAMTAVVGPFSSNWDRACELYAYLRGGQVDYGAHHSRVYNHARYGRTFPGIYPQWGEQKPIHIVGHSMAGQTARLMIELLRDGSADEINETPPEELSDLFKGGHDWVHSLFTISSTHNGTTLTERLKVLFKEMILALDALFEPSLETIYDFKLDQWGLTKEPGETFRQYVNRVFRSPLWNPDEVDFSTYDVSPEGAEILNSWVNDFPDIYHFSLATRTTFSVGPYQVPTPSTLFLFMPFALYMGTYSDTTPGPATPEEWRPNDGVVNSISMVGPWAGRAGNPVVTYPYVWPPADDNDLWQDDWPPEAGVWHYMGNVGVTNGEITPVSHSTIIGIMPGEGQRFHNYEGDGGLENLYLDIGHLLQRLPRRD